MAGQRDGLRALGLVGIASIYIGFAVADGRPKVIAVESSVTSAFVIVAAAAVTGSPPACNSAEQAQWRRARASAA